MRCASPHPSCKKPTFRHPGLLAWLVASVAAKLCFKNRNHFLPRQQQNSLQRRFSTSAAHQNYLGSFARPCCPGYIPGQFNQAPSSGTQYPHSLKLPKLENHWSKGPRQLHCLYVGGGGARRDPYNQARIPREDGTPPLCPQPSRTNPAPQEGCPRKQARRRGASFSGFLQTLKSKLLLWFLGVLSQLKGRFV